MRQAFVFMSYYEKKKFGKLKKDCCKYYVHINDHFSDIFECVTVLRNVKVSDMQEV